MFKKVKKVIVFALALTMLMGMGTMAFAAENESGIPELAKTNEEGMAVSATDDLEGLTFEIAGNEDGISPLWWPGDGPAPQVTKIQLERYGWLENGNFGVILKVYGYGSDVTTFNGKTIKWIEREPFIISGTGADGFYYLYDCGPITAEGSYPFISTFTSTNSPHKKVTYNDVFTFKFNQ